MADFLGGHSTLHLPLGIGVGLMTPCGVSSHVAPKKSGVGLTKSKSPSPRIVGGARTPKRQMSPKSVTKKAKIPTPLTTTKTKVEEVAEVGFEEHSKICDRMAKSLYFANKLPTTPRPSLALSRLAVSAFSKKARKDTLEFLDLEQAAEIGRNACVTPTALIMALVYLERLSTGNPSYLGTVKPSELFVVSLLVASKFIQDDGEDLGIFNDEWATSAKLELKYLNRMELEFLTAIDWNINVKPDEYYRVLEKLESDLAFGEGARRGWFTYTEITSLTNSLLAWNSLWPTLYQHCLKVIAAAYVTYAAVLVTVITTSILGPEFFMLSKTYLTSLTAPTTHPSALLSLYPNASLSANNEELFLEDGEIELELTDLEVGLLQVLMNETEKDQESNFLQKRLNYERFKEFKFKSISKLRPQFQCKNYENSFQEFGRIHSSKCKRENDEDNTWQNFNRISLPKMIPV